MKKSETQSQQKRKLIIKKIETGPSLAKGGSAEGSVTCQTNPQGCQGTVGAKCSW